MTLTFSITAVREVIARGRADVNANAGFRNPGLAPSTDERPGFWLVGDHGIYIISNGKLSQGAKALVVYAEECDPQKDDDWFDAKRRLYDGNDSVDFIPGETLEVMFAASPDGTHLRIVYLDDSMQLTVIRRDHRARSAAP